MENRKEIELDFEIDKLTNSIENTNSGDSFPTEISLLDISEIKEISYKNGWQFNWESEFKIQSRSVYKLTIAPNSKIIQGLVSLEVKSDHVYMHLIESAPLNIGNQKTYLGVPGNLVAFAKSRGTNYKMLKLLNPWLREKSFNNLKGRTYTILLPL